MRALDILAFTAFPVADVPILRHRKGGGLVLQPAQLGAELLEIADLLIDLPRLLCDDALHVGTQSFAQVPEREHLADVVRVQA